MSMSEFEMERYFAGLQSQPPLPPKYNHKFGIKTPGYLNGTPLIEFHRPAPDEVIRIAQNSEPETLRFCDKETIIKVIGPGVLIIRHWAATEKKLLHSTSKTEPLYEFTIKPHGITSVYFESKLDVPGLTSMVGFKKNEGNTESNYKVHKFELALVLEKNISPISSPPIVSFGLVSNGKKLYQRFSNRSFSQNKDVYIKPVELLPTDDLRFFIEFEAKTQIATPSYQFVIQKFGIQPRINY